MISLLTIWLLRWSPNRDAAPDLTWGVSRDSLLGNWQRTHSGSPFPRASPSREFIFLHPIQGFQTPFFKLQLLTDRLWTPLYGWFVNATMISEREVMGVMWRCNRSNWRLLLFSLVNNAVCWNQTKLRTKKLSSLYYRSHFWPPRLFLVLDLFL